jgi:hypothetical protein
MQKQPKQKIQLYKALKIGDTRNLQKQQKALKNYGYIIDKELTDPREQVIAYNPFQKKILAIENGTDLRSKKDLLTDFILLQGGLKETVRYKDTKNALMKAQKKYDVPADHINVVGYSLGGAIANFVTPSGANGYTYNAPYILNQKVRPNIHNYRVDGDIVSFNAPKETTKVIENHNEGSGPEWLLKTHSLPNIENLPVYF